MKNPKNIAASIRERLLNYAKSEKKPFQEILQYYAMERFLHRVSISDYANNYILKGGLMLKILDAPSSRPTMDIDLLGKTSNSESNIKDQFISILSLNLDKDDGLKYEVSTVTLEHIKEDADYNGIRVRFITMLTTARIHMQIDIGFSDIVYPKPKKSSLSTILNMDPPTLFVYSKETVVAEKFEAMIKLAHLNSRMKDFYDIWMLSRQHSFQGNDLLKAIKLTLENRKTDIPNNIEAFSTSFSDSKKIQWVAFLKKSNLKYVSKEFTQIIEEIKIFLLPVIQAIENKKTFSKTWQNSQNWN